MRSRSFPPLGAGFLLLLIAALAPTAARSQSPAADLTLSEAARIALEHHPAVKAAAAQVEAAATGIDQARAGFLPRVDLSEGVTRSDNPVYAFGSLLNQGRFT